MYYISNLFLWKQIIAWFVCDIWHKYHSWHFKIASNFTRLTAHEITYNNNSKYHLRYLCPNITTNHTITYSCIQRHVYINRLIVKIIFVSYKVHAMNYFASLGIFMRQWLKLQRYQNRSSPSTSSSTKATVAKKVTQNVNLSYFKLLCPYSILFNLSNVSDFSGVKFWETVSNFRKRKLKWNNVFLHSHLS